MKATDEFKGREVAVIGVARAGSAVARALAAAGARVTLHDSKPLESLGDEAGELLSEGFRIVAGSPDTLEAFPAEVVVPSPGVWADSPVLAAARERGSEVLGEIEVAYRLSEAPIVAITGTNGKSTTTAMCGEILREIYPNAWVGGNLAPGETLPSLAMKAGPEDVIVAEVSSFQLEQVSTFRPRVAVLTNLTPDHFDRHKDLTEYGAAKARIFAHQTQDDLSIVHADFMHLPELNLAQTLRGRLALFGADRESLDRALGEIKGGGRAEAYGAWCEDGWLVAEFQNRRERWATASSIPAPGRHNIENALAAGLAARFMGATPESIRRGLERFRPVAHRMEPVATVEGVRYVNNSMCTNPAALVASLMSYEEPVVLISGGKNKRLDFSDAGPKIARHAKAVVLIGTAAEEMEAAIGDGGASVVRADSMEDAVSRARSLAEPGDVVMLAPGCASMDMFSDFMDRGEQFAQAVRSLI